jgi:hypothetical protein
MRKANPKIAAKYFPKKRERIDTFKESFNKNHVVLWDAFQAWNSLDPFRTNAGRNEMYTFGNQWGDKIQDPETKKWITEEQHIKNQGNVPLKNNRIRGIVRSVLGVFSSSQTEPVCVSRDRDEQGMGEIMSTTLQYVYQLNKLWELDRRNLEYFLITGIAAFKSTAGWRNNKMDVWTDIVNYNRFFFDNHMKDPRHWDCHLVGEIHDIGLYDLLSQFSEGDKQRAVELRDMYSYIDKDRTIEYIDSITENRVKDLSFFIPEDPTRCRVIEIWKKESKERLKVHDRLTGEYYKVETYEEKILIENNRVRRLEQLSAGVTPDNLRLLEYDWFIDNYWCYYFMSPQGDVLKSGETPWWHDSHPYSFKIYPFFNGRVYPFVSDFIDQNRYINRLITLQDFIMRASAKGVLMFPEDQKPDGMTMEEIAEEWTAYNGMILYKPKPGVPPPEQIISSTVQTGAFEMLNIQLKLLEDISGVQGAMQGQAPASGTPASLYMQQVQNSSTSLTDMFESYREARQDRDLKNMKLIQQTYTDTRYINLVGKSGGDTIYNPDMVRNAEFDLSITDSQSTPAFRMVINDFLMQIFSAGQITLEEVLQNGAFPFADKLLSSIQDRKKAAEQGQPMGEIIPPEIQEQLNQQQ